jgi:hypothetical protein
VSRHPDPRTPAEWQEAVDLAELHRALWDCHLYGLLEGSLFEKFRTPAGRWKDKVNVARCDYLLAKGRERGVQPAPLEVLVKRYTRPADSIAAAAAAAVPNLEAS